MRVTWLSLAAVASAVVVFPTGALAQQPSAPVIPTPSELGDRRLDLVTDPGRLPKNAAEPPRRVGRPDGEVGLDVAAYAVNDDAPPEIKAALAELTQPFVGKGRSFADISDAAAAVTRYLQAELGYYLGFAYIPEQEPREGVLRIQVLEGRLDRVVLEWQDDLPVAREVVQAYIDQLEPGQPLKVRDVERIVFLVNDLRGIAADFEVRAGQSVGTAILVVRPRAQTRTTYRVEGDNGNPRTLGRARLSGNVTHYSPFGLGGTVSATAVASQGLAFALGSYSAPWGSSGTRLGLSASALRYQVDKDDFPLDIRGEAYTVSAFGLYPVVRSRNLNVFVTGAAEYKRYIDRQRDVSPVRKEVTNVNLGLTGDLRDSLLGGGLNSFDALVTFGKIDFGVKRQFDRPASTFTKLTARAVRLQSLIPGVVQGLASARLQKSWDNLDSTEQFRAGGTDGVRAIEPGEGSGDNGLIVTGELRFIVPPDWLSQLGGQAYVSVFYDRAVVQLRNDPVDRTVENTVRFGGGGIGLTWTLPQGWDVRASVAAPHTDEDDDKGARFNLQVGKQF